MVKNNDDKLLLKGELDRIEDEIHENASRHEQTVSRTALDINDVSAEQEFDLGATQDKREGKT